MQHFPSAFLLVMLSRWWIRYPCYQIAKGNMFWIQPAILHLTWRPCAVWLASRRRLAVYQSHNTDNYWVLFVAGHCRCDERRLTPVHAAAGWRLREVLELLIQAKCDINAIDEAGRTPLYLCTAALSSVLYREDMRVRLPCLQLLMLHGADVLNLVEWLMSKGSDIPSELHAEHREFLEWYRAESRNPGSLKNLCRKSVQLRLRQRADWVVSVDRLPLPPCLKQYVRRKLFIRPDRGQLASNTAVIGAHNAACL